MMNTNPPSSLPPSQLGQKSRKAGRAKLARKVVLAVVIAIGGIVLWTMGRDYLSLERLAEQEGQLRALQLEHPLAVYAVAFVFYVVTTGLSLPGAAILTVVYGWYFGFLKGLVLVSFASTAGATLAFLLSRYFFREPLQNRFGDKLARLNQNFEREGPFYLFTMRLIAAFPFFMINLLMGLTPIKTSTYWWVSQLGMLPGTMAYVFAGSTVPDLTTLAREGMAGLVSVKLLVAFGILGVLPLLVRAIVNRLR